MNMSLFNGPSNNNKSSNNNINNFQKSPNNTANKQLLDHSRSTSPSSGAEDCSTASSLCTASSTGSSGHGSSNRNNMPQSVAGLPKANPLAPVFHPRQHYEHNTNNNNNTLSVLSEEGSSLTPTAGSASAKMNNFQPTSGSSTPPSMASLPLSMHRENNAQGGSQAGVQRTQIQTHLQNSNSQHQSQMEQNFGQTQNFGGQSQNNNNFGQFGQTQTQKDVQNMPHNQNQQGQIQQHQDQNQMVHNMSQNMTQNMSQIDQNAYNFQRNSNNSASFAQQNQFRPNQLTQNQLTSQSQANINVQEAQQNSINFYQNNGLQNNSVPAQLSNFMNKRDSQNSLYKTEQCRSYGDTGSCRYGNKCQFAHGTEEVRNLSRHPKYKTEMCRSYHTTGHCPYSTRCHFIHELSQRGQRIEDGPPVRRGGRNQTSPNMRDMGATNPNFQSIQQNMAGNGQMSQMGQMHQAQNMSQSMGQHMGHLAVGQQGQQQAPNSNMWSVGGVSMADRMKNSNSNVTISHESSNRFESSGVFTQNSSTGWNNSNNVVRQDSNNDMFDNNFRTPVKFDMGWNENKNDKVEIQAKKEAEINSWGSGFGNPGFSNQGSAIQGSGDNQASYNKNSGFNGTLDWGKSASKPASYEKPKSQSSIFGSESIFSNPSNTKINTSGGQSRFDTAWSTNVEASCEKKLASSERTPSSSIFDQNNNPMEDEFSFNDIFNQMSVQDKSKQVVQGGSGQGECSIFGGGASLFESNKRVNNSTSTSSNRSHRLPVFQELTDNV